MWKEITSVEDESFYKLSVISNDFGCHALDERLTDSNKVFDAYINKKKDIHKVFLYEDSEFEILLAFRFIEKDNMYECIRFIIKWDTSNDDINPKDALYHSARKTKEFMEQTGLKVFMKPFNRERIKDLLLSAWCDDDVAIIYESLGIKMTREAISKDLDYLLFELM